MCSNNFVGLVLPVGGISSNSYLDCKAIYQFPEIDAVPVAVMTRPDLQ
jgi:hypothetical protein